MANIYYEHNERTGRQIFNVRMPRCNQTLHLYDSANAPESPNTSAYDRSARGAGDNDSINGTARVGTIYSNAENVGSSSSLDHDLEQTDAHGYRGDTPRPERRAIQDFSNDYPDAVYRDNAQRLESHARVAAAAAAAAAGPPASLSQPERAVRPESGSVPDQRTGQAQPYQNLRRNQTTPLPNVNNSLPTQAGSVHPVAAPTSNVAGGNIVTGATVASNTSHVDPLPGPSTTTQAEPRSRRDSIRRWFSGRRRGGLNRSITVPATMPDGRVINTTRTLASMAVDAVDLAANGIALAGNGGGN